MSTKSINGALVWLRRDLRVDDNAALYHALRAARQVWCAYIFDRAQLDALPRADRRVEFVRDSLVGLEAQLQATAASHGVEGIHLLVRHGHATQVLTALAAELHVQAVYTSHDDEPESLAAEARLRGSLADVGISLHTGKDHALFERSEVLTQAGGPFSVFTPYKNAWLKKLEPYFVRAYPVAHHAAALAPVPAGVAHGVPTLADIGFLATDLHSLKLPTGAAGAQELLADFLSRIERYEETRNFPAIKGPSYLSAHLRFGTVSIRQLVREASLRAKAGSRGAEVWLSELVWRDFYHQVLHHHPHVVGNAFKREYDAISWEHGKQAEALFAAWCEGRTGYPIVDAGMHQLNQTGYMHNRLRMVTASFLVKDLGLDWRWGERYFAEKLTDFDLAANNGGWQWSASTGCDAQPYFRIFNPVSQSEKFDPEGKFIRRYLPALAALPDALIHAPWQARPIDLEAARLEIGRDYPAPIVQHEQARAKTLARYAAVKGAK